MIHIAAQPCCCFGSVMANVKIYIRGELTDENISTLLKYNILANISVMTYEHALSYAKGVHRVGRSCIWILQ